MGEFTTRQEQIRETAIRLVAARCMCPDWAGAGDPRHVAKTYLELARRLHEDPIPGDK